MTPLRTAVLGAVLWCAVVVAAASLVWVVIGRAGQGVVPASLPQADVTASLPVPHHDHGPGSRPSAGVKRSSLPSRSTSTSTSPSVGRSPTQSPAAPPPVVPAAQRRSWSGTPGHVVTECRGPSVRLVAAYPNAGWRYLIGSRDPTVARVAFTRSGEDARAVTVESRCVAGVPHFAQPGHPGGDT